MEDKDKPEFNTPYRNTGEKEPSETGIKHAEDSNIRASEEGEGGQSPEEQLEIIEQTIRQIQARLREIKQQKEGLD